MIDDTTPLGAPQPPRRRGRPPKAKKETCAVPAQVSSDNTTTPTSHHIQPSCELQPDELMGVLTRMAVALESIARCVKLAADDTDAVEEHLDLITSQLGGLGDFAGVVLDQILASKQGGV